MVPEFSMFFMFFSAIVLAWINLTQQKIAEVINFDSSLTKDPVFFIFMVKNAFFWAQILCDP